MSDLISKEGIEPKGWARQDSIPCPSRECLIVSAYPGAVKPELLHNLIALIVDDKSTNASCARNDDPLENDANISREQPTGFLRVLTVNAQSTGVSFAAKSQDGPIRKRNTSADLMHMRLRS